MSKVLKGAFALAAVIAVGGVAQAFPGPSTDPYSVELVNHTLSNDLFPGDTRVGGSGADITPDGISDPLPNDGDQTVVTKFEITNGNSKVGPYFYTEAQGTYNPAAPQSFGVLGELDSVTVDWYRASPDLDDNFPGGKQAAWYIPAFRIYVQVDNPAAPTGELIWENAYNEGYEATATADTWVNNLDLVDNDVTMGATAGRFYLRADPDGVGVGAGRTNYGDASGYTLEEWLDGTVAAANPSWPTLSPENLIFGFTASIGSGAPNGVGYLDDVTFNFIPEPTTLGLLGFGAVLGLRRRKQA